VIGTKANQLIKPLSMSQKAWREMWGIIGIPRTLLSAGELSATWRQGGLLLFRNPIISAKSFARQLQAGAPKISLRLLNRSVETMTGEGVAEARLASWESHPIIQEYGQKLYLAPIGEAAEKAAMGLREEAFVSRTIQRVPILGHMVKMSERAYITFLNEMRARSFVNRIEGRLARGWEVSPEEADIMADWINIATGRGKLGGFERAGGELSTVLYSPRLWAARLETLPYAGYAAAKSPMMRAEVAKDLVTFIMGNLSLLGLAKLSGVADVELDPRSTDFGKIRIGHQRLDPWGGFQQITRTVAQVATGEIKAARTGEVYDADRLVQLGRYMQGKLSPAAGFLVDVMRGETMIGQEMTTSGESLKAQTWNRLVPMWWQDVKDAVDEYGAKGFIGVLPGALGWGTQTYKSAYEGLVDAQDTAARALQNPATGQPYKDFAELAEGGTPRAKAMIAADPGVVAAQAKVEEEKQRHGGEGARKSLSSALQGFTSEQEKADTTITDNSKWRDDHSDRQMRRAGAIAEWERENPDAARRIAADEAKITDPFALPADASPDTVLAAYHKVFALHKTPTGGVDDRDTLTVDLDRFEAALTPSQSASLEENTGTNKTDKEKEYLVATRMIEPYWEIEDNLWQSLILDNPKALPKLKAFDTYRAYLDDAQVRAAAKGLAPAYAYTDPVAKEFEKRMTVYSQAYLLHNPEVDAERVIWSYAPGVHSKPAFDYYFEKTGLKPRVIVPD
jgi:hypothetical protein